MFITIPKVFASMGFGTFAGVMFFLLVLFAALTSSIALTESAVSTFEDERWVEPEKSTVLCGVIMIALGSLSSLGYGPLENVKIIGMQFLDFFDFLTNSVMIRLRQLLPVFLFQGLSGKENRRRSDIRWRHIQKKKSLSVYDTVSVSDFCWNHFIKLCRKCIWMDFHVNALR